LLCHKKLLLIENLSPQGTVRPAYAAWSVGQILSAAKTQNLSYVLYKTEYLFIQINDLISIFCNMEFDISY